MPYRWSGGLDPRAFTLLAFGGAGPVHASVVARAIGIGRILIPPHPGLLCAQGLIVANQLEYFVRTVRAQLGDDLTERMRAPIGELHAEAAEWFRTQGIAPEDAHTALSLEMHYVGQNFELGVPLDADVIPDAQALEAAFTRAHDEAYGFHNARARVEIVSVRLAASGMHRHDIRLRPAASGRDGPPVPSGVRPVWFDRSGAKETPIFSRDLLEAGDEIAGPAIVEQLDTTTVIFPGDAARVDAHGNLLIEVRP